MGSGQTGVALDGLLEFGFCLAHMSLRKVVQAPLIVMFGDMMDLARVSVHKIAQRVAQSESIASKLERQRTEKKCGQAPMMRLVRPLGKHG